MLKAQAYTILEVSEDSDSKAIKKAYRKMASKFHPDKHQDATKKKLSEIEGKFKEAKDAYELLTGKTSASQEDDPFGGWKQAFEDMERDRRAAMANGRDMQVKTSIPIELAINGGNHNIKINTFHVCNNCGGRGTVLKQDTNGFSSHSYCSACNSSGKVSHQIKQTLIIPPNSNPGLVLRVANQGEPKRGDIGKPGDLYVTLFIKSDDYFDDLRGELCVNVVIDAATWLIGGRSEVATPTGPVEIVIPSMPPEGSTMRIGGKGINGTNIFIKITIDRSTIGNKDLLSSIEKLREDLIEIKDSDANKFIKLTKDKIKILGR